MTDNMFAASMARLCAEYVTPEQVREVEQSKDVRPIWSALEQSGFCDALVAEKHGGAELGLNGAFTLVFACGKFVMPVPLAYTMAIRAFLADQGVAIPDGPMTLALAMPAQDGEAINCHNVLYGEIADWVLVQQSERVLLLPTNAAKKTSSGVFGSLNADLCWTSLPEDTVQFDKTNDWAELGACMLAGQMAGAVDSVFRMTLDYAGQRKQFGRAIGKFQAIQQQISVMAEQAAAMRTAAQIGFASSNWYPQSLAASIAKSRCSDAVSLLTSSAHSIHGAIGITAEYDLQLFTRRLHDWRFAFGSEAYWNGRIGHELLDKHEPVVDFIRTSVDLAI